MDEGCARRNTSYPTNSHSQKQFRSFVEKVDILAMCRSSTAGKPQDYLNRNYTA